MVNRPIVTGLSPKEGPPGTRVTIRGEFLGSKTTDLVGLIICGCDCLLSAEWKSDKKIIARTGAAKGKGDIIVTTRNGGTGTSTVQFRAYYETIGPMKESAVWIEESPMQSLAWGRRSLAPTGYIQEDPLGLSIEGNDKKFPEDLRDIFPDGSGDLSQENFLPGWFLLENHHATSFEDLKAGLSYLRRRVESQKEGQLSFLKSNAGSVMDQLDTLMALRDRVSQDTKLYGKDQVKDLEVAIQKSIDASHELFKDVLSRKEKADATRAALSALSRHKFLFCLPNSVEKSAARNEFDIVVNDYARVKNLFGKTEVPIFKKVLEEVDLKILGIRQQLHGKIKEMPQGVEQQKKLVKALISLEAQQAGTSVASRLKIEDPAWDAIEARAKYLEDTFLKSYEQYTGKEGTPESKSRSDPNATPVRVQFCEEMTEIAASQFPDLWRLGQAYFTGELRGAGQPKPGNFKRIILTVIEQFCSYLKAALLPAGNQRTLLASTMKGLPTWPASNLSLNYLITWLPHCLRYVRVSYATLIRLDLPGEALDIVLKFIDELRLYCLSTILKKANEKVKKLHEKETWEFPVADFAGATGLPSKLEEILTEAIDDAQVICLTPEIRETSLLEPQSDGQREMSKRIQELLGTFCGVIETLALQRSDEDPQQAPMLSQLIGFPAALLQQQISGGTDKSWGSSITWEQRMLCCLSNCIYCNKVFFPKLAGLFTKHNYPVPSIAIENSRSTVNTLFSSLLDMYVEHKSDPLVGTIEPSMYIGRFQWDQVGPSDKLSPYAHECCDNLVSVYSEIFSISPVLLRPVLEPIVQTVAEELARLMTCVQKFNVNGALQAKVDINVIRDAVRVYSNDTAKSFFVEALEAIPQVAESEDRIQDTVRQIKNNMRLQLMCLQVVDP
ncbi:exocyst complex component 2 [Culex quinquefasciatus]|uniref:Exocyst complex component 2 n=1 Tax=Culex quinquefasciatus TaxID=7176 RepID=B0W3D0_CULQU|nr:exocyst complex component 2 [Culex quinquefasciatus]|eukprot:XP_001843214.1 exocyst complex component 2 [Culex quinquefasciatus]